MSDEAHFSAKQPRPRTAPRLPSSDVDSGRSGRDPRPSRAGPSQAQRLTTVSARKDFLAANSAKRRATAGFVLLVRHRADGEAHKRVGFTVTKKIGNAVIRNRMKRRLRALAQEVIASDGAAGCDHILIGRAGGVERNYAALKTDLVTAVAKLTR